MVIPNYVFGNFEIDNSKTKWGGQASVLKGSHPVHGDVAIKQFNEKNDSIEAYNEAKFLMENGYHRNIVQVIGILVDEKSKYIGYIMPYMANGSLHDGMQYDQMQIGSWITQICRSLSYLHLNQIIHRDIKPSNVLLGTCCDDVKLSDFGIARQLDNIARDLTTGLGTPLYMAPEILKKENYDISADIYSLSITIWEILHRRIPFDHVTNKSELYNKVLNGERPVLKDDLSEEISDLLTRCWHTDASFRPTIKEVLELSRNAGFQCRDLEKVVEEASNNEETLSKIRASLISQNEDIQFLNATDNNLEKETILLLGGHDGEKSLDSLLILQNSGKDWKQLTVKLPYEVDNHGAQFLNKHIYIFGGKNVKGDILNSMYKLLKNLEWEKMTEMSQSRLGISSSSVILNDRIWVLGGLSTTGALKTVEMYNPVTNKWKCMKEMNETRYDAAATVVRGKIFCCGGWNWTHLKSVECYDSSSDVWTLMSNMPEPVIGFGAAEMNGNLIVIGGWTGQMYLNNLWVQDTTDANMEWIEKSSMSFSRSHYCIAKANGKIFVCGGKFTRGPLDDVEIFDGYIWSNGPKLTTLRKYAASVVIPIEFAKWLN